MKRAFDLVVAILGLAVATPILVACAVLIRLDTPGPAFFRQRRVGLNGQEFELLKLRSMVTDAPALGGHSTASNDPRITKIGRLLRKTSLDELPQLVNVIKGDMSIVGPRPDVPAQEADYPAEAWMLRNSVRPGITGLAQVHGRSNSTPEDRLRLDLQYARSHGLRTDLQICVLTARQLLRGGTT